MGNRNSTPQDQQSGGAPPPPSNYAQYPSPQGYRPNSMMAPAVPPPHQPTYYPPSNGQYYGGWAPPQQPPNPYMQQRPHQPPPHGYPQPQPYPHGPGPVPQHQQQQQSPATPAPVPQPPPPTQQLTQTATIRNSVNLKKASLEVKPLVEYGDTSNKLGIYFNFDASAPCVVSTFVLATEDAAKGNKLSTAYQAPGPMVHYPKGLGHKFPPSGSDINGDSNSEERKNNFSLQQQHMIDLSMHQDDLGALSASNGNTFPLVIRLEVVTERGLKDGHTLEELVPGAEQQSWAQSQTTFAALHKEEDGSWSVRVLKQKIWVDGTSYELQEIYGLEQAGKRPGTGTAGGASAAEEAEERLCVICLVNPRDTTVLPCRHMCLCSDCASELRKQSSKCPICRNNIESLLHIRINKENKERDSTIARSGGGGGGTDSGQEREPATKVDGEVNGSVDDQTRLENGAGPVSATAATQS